MSGLIRFALLIVCGFLALSAIAGGIGLLADLNAPPVDYLAGSPFPDYTIPGLALLLVGVLALAAAVMAARRRRYAAHVAALSGVAIVVFEIVELLVIGSPPGVARDLQIVYISAGVIILVLASVQLLTERSPASPRH